MAPTDRSRRREVPVAGLASALTLLDSAQRGLAEAAGAAHPVDRYAAAHLAALRTAAAVLAVRAHPAGSRRRPRSAWEMLAQVAPELGEWASFFAAGAGKRAAAEAGLSRAVSTREADDLLRDAQTFLALVETHLGLTPSVPAPVPVPAPASASAGSRPSHAAASVPA